ncbi:MAG: tyrosine-protein phosphatase [Bacillota bacterium]
MIDIHSHLVYGMDDGAPTIEESIKMVQQAVELGISTIVATPHFQEQLFDIKGIVDNFNEIVERTKEYGVDLRLGSEVFINPFIPEIVEKESLLLLNESRYLLLELPYDIIPVYTFETIYRLQLRNIYPIIAHPERNMNLLKDFDEFVNFLERGCLIQVDAGSIAGVYGNTVREFAKKLIKLNMAHFIASDAHCSKDYAEWHLQSYKKVINWAGKEYADKLFNENPKLVLENLKGNIYEMI